MANVFDKKAAKPGKTGWSAGRKPGKPGTVGKLFPLEKKGQRGKI